MKVDNLGLFSDSQDVAVAGPIASTNVVDLSEPRDIGTGEPLYLVSLVKQAFTDAGSDSTLAVLIQTDTVENFASPTAAQTVGTFGALSAAGTVLITRLDPGKIDERYMRVLYTAANGDLTTGAVTTFLTNNIDKWKAYADNITIS